MFQKAVGNFDFLLHVTFSGSISGYFVITQRLIQVRLLSELARNGRGFLPTALVVRKQQQMSLHQVAAV
jgi:hypothetical protein